MPKFHVGTCHSHCCDEPNKSSWSESISKSMARLLQSNPRVFFCHLLDMHSILRKECRNKKYHLEKFECLHSLSFKHALRGWKKFQFANRYNEMKLPLFANHQLLHRHLSHDDSAIKYLEWNPPDTTSSAYHDINNEISLIDWDIIFFYLLLVYQSMFGDAIRKNSNKK